MAGRTQGRKGDRSQRAGLGAQHPQAEAGGCGPWRERGAPWVRAGEGTRAVPAGLHGPRRPLLAHTGGPRGAARSRRGRTAAGAGRGGGGRTCRQGLRLEREAPLSPRTAFPWTPASSSRSVSGSDRVGGAHLFNSPHGARRLWVRNQQTEPQVVHMGRAGAHRSSGGLRRPAWT